MPQKSVYLDADIIKWLEKQAKKETRTFSNYLQKLVRDRMSKDRK